VMNNEGAPANEGADRTFSDPDSSPDHRHDEVLRVARGFCVVVETPTGRYRRRLYLSLSSAEKSVERARANGKYAAIVLATITPVGVVA